MTMLQATDRLTQDLGIDEATFESWDGAELFYRAWKPAVPSEKALLLFHRGHEHSGRLIEFVKDLGLDDVNIFAWDARGHGRSPGERGYAHDFASVVKDMDWFARYVCREHEVTLENTVVLGHSVGAVALAAWIHDYAPPVRAMVLATPAFRIKLYVPLALPALRLRSKLPGRSFIKSYIKPRMLTHDATQAETYAADPLISRNIATNVLIDLFDTATRLLDDAAAIQTPTLVLCAGSDWVVKNSATRTFFGRLSSPVKEIVTYDGFHHAILHETDRHRPIAKIRQFISHAFDRPADEPSLLGADESGYTLDEFKRLSQPLPAGCPRRLNFAVQRLGMKTLCRLSDGVRLGWQCGFDSGESLDYVYRNRPSGKTPLGRLIDGIYLNSPGWRGIRRRKADLQATLRFAMDDIRGQGQPVRIVDIAAGGGRYLLEQLQDLGGADVSAVLRDRSPAALEMARHTATDMGIARVNFEEGDAFDRQELADLWPRPNIAIVSGLYELFRDNRRVGQSLAGLADAISPSGLLIYTNQPWHPQIEMIARVLINRDGEPWIMRRRTQAEMDQLVAAAGFEKIDMRIDPAGIFTVSVARRKE